MARLSYHIFPEKEGFSTVMGVEQISNKWKDRRRSPFIFNSFHMDKIAYCAIFHLSTKFQWLNNPRVSFTQNWNRQFFWMQKRMNVKFNNGIYKKFKFLIKREYISTINHLPQANTSCQACQKQNEVWVALTSNTPLERNGTRLQA